VVKTPTWKADFRRGWLVREAQRLARSGQHADCTTLILQLQSLDGFDAARERFEDRALRSQLDRLCALAQEMGSKPVRRSAS
jgi:hypothetical protein